MLTGKVYKLNIKDHFSWGKLLFKLDILMPESIFAYVNKILAK